MIIPILSIIRNNLPSFNYLRLEIHEALRRGDLNVDSDNCSRLIYPPKIVNFHLRIDDPKIFYFSLLNLELVEQKINDFHLYKPKHGYQCWDAPLPCSHFLTFDDIKLRNPQHGICGGFVKRN